MTVSGNNMSIASSVTTGGDTIAVTLASLSSDAGNTIGGGLASLADIDVSTGRGATAALDQIEGLLQTSVNAAASFGSDEKRLDTQTAFNSKLTSAMQSGIGTLVDADLEEASARLQALQVQQQLSIQALSIANSAPQTLLGLFR